MAWSSFHTEIRIISDKLTFTCSSTQSLKKNPNQTGFSSCHAGLVCAQVWTSFSQIFLTVHKAAQEFTDYHSSSWFIQANKCFVCSSAQQPPCNITGCLPTSSGKSHSSSFQLPNLNSHTLPCFLSTREQLKCFTPDSSFLAWSQLNW